MVTKGLVEIACYRSVSFEFGGFAAAGGRRDGSMVPLADAKQGQGQLGICWDALEDGVSQRKILPPLGVFADRGQLLSLGRLGVVNKRTC